MSKTEINEITSKYFNFNLLNEFKENEVSKYEGWHGLYLIKINLKKNEELSSNYLKNKFPEIYNKEKILVVVKGQLQIETKSKFVLNNYDALNYFLEDKKSRITCLENTSFFIVSSKELEIVDGKEVFFNFKKDIDVRDLWGGQCISRPYEGVGLNLVLFDLKPGFKFEDKGHANEQITWVIEGEMNFHSNGLKKKLTPYNGVDIGPKHPHGGISNGAIGFDVFYPKRKESKYKKNLHK